MPGVSSSYSVPAYAGIPVTHRGMASSFHVITGHEDGNKTSSALDYQTRLQVGDDIGQIIRKEGNSAILVTHDLSEAISLADRVIVLSGRPATIQQTIPLIFDLDRDTPLARRNAPEFKTYFNLIWEELNANV